MRLVKEDISNINRWLKRKGIKYIDIRYELIDHLVTEYEQMDNYPDLHSFLNERKEWCRRVAKEKQKTVNFGTTKSLFKKFLSFFINFKPLVIIVGVGFLLFGFHSIVPERIFRNALFCMFFVPIIYQLYLMVFSGFGNRLKKESVSAVYLINSFVFPQLPMYFIGQIPETLLENPQFYISFFVVFTLLNIAAILVFHEKRRTLLKEFELLKSSLI